MAPRKRMLLPLVVGIVGLIAVLGYWVARRNHPSNSLRISGNIEVTDAEVSFKIPGRVLQRLVSEGQSVNAGQVVALMENTDLKTQVEMRKADVLAADALLRQLRVGSRPEEIDQAKAAMEQSQARLNELLAGSRRQEIAAAEAALALAKADAARAQLDFERYARLFQKVNVSAQQYDAAKAANAMAQARVEEAQQQLALVKEGPRREQIEQARAALEQARDHYALIKKGPRREEIEHAEARYQAAQDALALAQTQLSYTTLTAPFSGVVLTKNVEPGEYVSPGTPVITIADLKNVWLRGYIDETDLVRVKLGQRVWISTDTYPGKKYAGHISFISDKAEFTPKSVQTDKERVKLVYRIKVDVSNPNMELKAGMPADGLIDLSGS